MTVYHCLQKREEELPENHASVINFMTSNAQKGSLMTN